MDAFTQRMTDAMSQQGQGQAPEEAAEKPANKEAENKVTDLIAQAKDALAGLSSLIDELEKANAGEEESEMA